jgi:hypothetical protein
MAASVRPLQNALAPTDFTGRLPSAVPNADQGMIVQPSLDPGYGMPNPDRGNLNQAPGQTVGGWLPVNALGPPNFAEALRQLGLTWPPTTGGA